MDELSGKKTPFRRFVERIVDLASDYPFVVLGLTVALIVANVFVATHLEIRSDFLDLLPKNSNGYKAFIHQQGRVGGGSSLYVVVKSPVRAANEHFIDDISAALASEGDKKRACIAACAENASCKATCGRPMVAYVEGGSKDLRAFFQKNRWLYAKQEELEKADEELDHKIALQAGLVDDLSDDTPAPKPNAEKSTEPAKKDTTLADLEAKSEAAYKKYDDYPTGYFATEKGDEFAMRIVATTASLGDKLGDDLYAFTQAEVERLKKEDAARPVAEQRYTKDIVVGVGGDIANAVAEKKSIVSEAAGAVIISFAAILLGIIFYFRRISALAIVFLPAFIGVSSAYAFATATFGYVNTAGAFLGAIILGNGINYPIVLYGRYLEFRARGLSPAEARRGAVWNAFRAELVGALVAGIAYGSLTVTSFRGFSQFGTIGFVGMLLVWLSIIPVVPALVVLNERFAAFIKAKTSFDIGDGLLSKIPGLGPSAPPVDGVNNADEKHGFFVNGIANVTARFPKVFAAIAVLMLIGAGFVLPKYLKDPWEYDLSRLGSDAAQKKGGSDGWTEDANRIFGGRNNLPGVLVLADNVAQVPLVKKKILDNDKTYDRPFIADVKTVADFLPGSVEEQKAKLEVIDRIRDRLTPRVLESLSEEDRARAQRLMPPDDLKPLVGVDLPPLIRRRFEELNGSVGTVMYVSFNGNPRLRMGQDLIRIAATCDNLTLDDGTFVQTASTFTVRAELVKSMAHDGPIATFASFFAVLIVIAFSTGSFRGFGSVLAALLLGVTVTVAGAAAVDMRLNFINFIALPITFGIGVEYPFNLFDRARLLGGDMTLAIKRSAGAVILCSFTTTVGYGSLVFSDQRALKSFGKLAMSGEVGCIIAALFFLPSFLRLWPSKTAPSAKTE